MSLDIKEKLQKLLQFSVENETVEFKIAKTSFEFDKLGQYFSALSNEANLKSQPEAWLVFGVKDDKEVVGTQYKSVGGLQDLKNDIAVHTTNRVTFLEIYEVYYLDKRIILFQIPAAPKGMPIAWHGHNYARDGESLVALNPEEYERIRNQVMYKDWSAEICANASIADLDKEALTFARLNFKNKNPRLVTEIDQWDDITFLNKAKITINSKITNTALILLGKDESQHFISPCVAQITWVLKDKNNIELDYQHFGMPLILNAENAVQKIRNLTYRYLPDNTIFPTEVTQYEPYVIREALHNCIAHQDYSMLSRINLMEFPDYLIFDNSGSFIPGSISNVIEGDLPQRYYRNKFLCDAMVALNMIDTIGSGIKKMFDYQRNRFFPLPDYEFKNSIEVKVKILGKIIDKNYTQLLIKSPDISMHKVILLDCVQKNKPLLLSEAQDLRKIGLIEGRRPNYFIAAHVAAVYQEKANYIKNKAFDDEHYKKMIVAFIEQYGIAVRSEIEDLLMNKLSSILTIRQKKNKITVFLSKLKKDGLIINGGSRTKPQWKLKEIKRN